MTATCPTCGQPVPDDTRAARARILNEVADQIESKRSLLGIASRALDPGRAWCVYVLRDRAADLLREEGQTP